MRHILFMFLLVGASWIGSAAAAAEFFDFDSAPINTSLPIDVASGDLSAHLSGASYAVWASNVYGFTPAGFSGLSIWPSAVSASDLTITFNKPLTDWSILYATQENGTDNSGVVRATGFLGGNSVVTNTHQAPGGTWPTATLSLSSASAFDTVVMHWVSHPPGDIDYGPIFTVDNMTATAFVPEPGAWLLLVPGLASLLARRRAHQP